MLPPRPTPGFDIDSFARLPVLVGGRVMPMDTLGRLSLLAMNHFGTYTGSDGKVAQPTAWLLEVFMQPEHADTGKVFYINNPDVLDLAGFSDRKETLYSFNDLKPSLTQIDNQSRLAIQVDSETRNPFQRDILKLREALLLYWRLKNSVQAEGSADFAKEVDVFASVIGPGLRSVRARDEGKPFDQNAFQNILQFTQSASIPTASWIRPSEYSSLLLPVSSLSSGWVLFRSVIGVGFGCGQRIFQSYYWKTTSHGSRCRSRVVK
jgi:hypothetical protein